MSFIKDLWNILVLAFCLSCYGGFPGITYKFGMSAQDLHQKGMFSLARYNRSLVGPETLGR